MKTVAKSVNPPKADEAYHFRVGQEVLLTAFCPNESNGAAKLLRTTAEIGQAVKELAAQFSVAAPYLSTDIQFKLVGDSAALKDGKIALGRLGISPAGAYQSQTGLLDVYFYPQSGRLRVAEAGAKVTPIGAAKKKVKVLIVDDSHTIHAVLTKVFSKEPAIEIVGYADRPSQVEGLIKKLKPDVVTLDVHMPEKDGVTLLGELLPKYPLPFIMISSLSMADGASILNALEIGAVDYIQKPSLAELPTVGPLIVEKVMTASTIKEVRREITTSSANHGPVGSFKRVSASSIIAIGSSTGGTEAVKAILVDLPAEIPPILVVQHIPPVFSKAFAQRLNDCCPFEVKEAEDGDEVLPNRVLIAPGGLQMKIVDNHGKLTISVVPGDPSERHKPSVDFLFNTVAQIYGKRAVGVVLTGMGNDGSKGLLQMRKAGARTMAQDEATSVVFGMPKEALANGGAERAYPIHDMARTLCNLFGDTTQK